MAALIKTDKDGQTWARCIGCDGWIALMTGDEGNGIAEPGALHDPYPACEWFMRPDTDALDIAQAINRRLSARTN